MTHDVRSRVRRSMDQGPRPGRGRRVDSPYSQSADMNHRASLLIAVTSLALSVAPAPCKAAEAPVSGAEDHATISFSVAPWDGAAYDLEIRLDASPSILRINIWGNPEFAEPTTLYFSGREDPGGGPSRGSGRAAFQAIPNKSWPDNLTGSISFAALQKGHPVSGSYEFATLDGKKKFNGHFRALWSVNGR
jgi:hypothetical protein